MENTTEIATNADATLGLLQGIATSSLYLMGFSFILGSCFTILLLMLLDYMRMRREGKTKTAA